ncbi:helix-turn-helix domain-containing protein [Pantanalinema rosaneae CENA516]|uniref:helix-turn-helix domain-containing protein n=1 Tax=Pantanalinema rosaneae TaxID=1620701 RepID=UPI003D6FFC9A
MVTQDSVYVLGVPDGAIEVSVDALRGIFRQIETELCRSEPYERVMAELETMPSELSKQVQLMVRSVGREAIRLVFRKLIRRKDAIDVQPEQQPAMNLAAVAHFNATPAIVPPPPPPQNPHPESLLMTESTHESSLSAMHLEASLALESVPQACLANSPHGNVAQGTTTTKPTKPTKRLSKAEQAAQALLQARETRLQELGEEIRQLRQARSMSLYELHCKTLIPMHQLEALETGQIDRLPEDIYIRGFIRRLGDALGMDGMAWAESIPHLDPAKAAIPSWYKPRVKSKMPSAYLFLGYAAVMAAGLAWVSRQTLPTNSSPTSAPFIPEEEASAQPNLSTKIGAKEQSTVPAPVSPPEAKPTKRQWANR